MSKMGLALQMYTLREELKTDFVGTLRKVAALGYEGVEFAGYGGLTASELRRLLDELKLTAVGSHVGIADLRDKLEEVIAYNHTIGNRTVICPFLPVQMRGSASAWKETAELFNQIGRRLAEEGIQFGYHNHSFEFEEQVGDQLAFDALFSWTSPEWVKVEMDVCWVQNGGQDPVTYIRTYAGRLPLLHLKDLKTAADGTVQTVELGNGDVDLSAVISAAQNAGVSWMIVEQDNCQRPALESVEISMKWLKTNYLS